MSDLCIELQENFERMFGFWPDMETCIEYVEQMEDTDVEKFNEWCIKNNKF